MKVEQAKQVASKAIEELSQASPGEQRTREVFIG
jgi:hypothetical protein